MDWKRIVEPKSGSLADVYYFARIHDLILQVQVNPTEDVLFAAIVREPMDATRRAYELLELDHRYHALPSAQWEEKMEETKLNLSKCYPRLWEYRGGDRDRIDYDHREGYHNNVQYLKRLVEREYHRSRPQYRRVQP